MIDQNRNQSYLIHSVQLDFANLDLEEERRLDIVGPSTHTKNAFASFQILMLLFAHLLQSFLLVMHVKLSLILLQHRQKIPTRFCRKLVGNKLNFFPSNLRRHSTEISWKFFYILSEIRRKTAQLFSAFPSRFCRNLVGNKLNSFPSNFRRDSTEYCQKIRRKIVEITHVYFATFSDGFSTTLARRNSDDLFPRTMFVFPTTFFLRLSDDKVSSEICSIFRRVSD
ncbi:hypothetical protein CARUB_v10028375mg [Capsella rubella]|uniref:Uncharacterized protein n=1 Tax=Capsella rubella TaxID=81985 RepID=R0F198_9BRAS|nr:hypothetical protein CARUB_v10028375mg [Capsella rubella]